MQRYVIVGITAIAALWMYIDRVCFSTLAPAMNLELLLPLAPEPSEADELSPEEVAAAKKRLREKNPEAGEDVQLSAEDVAAAKKRKWADQRMSFVLGAFFLTYALFQIPMGTLADRFGARAVLAVSIAAWSLVTMATGFTQTFVALFAIRLLLGITESGAYPAAAGLVKRWARPEERGRFSSVVALGGRVGGAIAPFLTTTLAVGLIGVGLAGWSDNPSGKNWRGVFVLYGACGLAVAALFWLLVRDHPPAGFSSSLAGKGAEGAGSAEDNPSPDPGSPGVPPPAPPRSHIFRQIGRLARTRNMWLFGAVQFGVNVPWAFLITLLPQYLGRTFGVPIEQIGPMQTTALTIGICGMFFGGLMTDGMRAWLGPKLGRSVPIAVALLGCAAVMFVVPTLPTAWVVVVALGVMAFLVDMHNPSIWAFAQDVGGRNVGAALGWGNMWGNLGAAVSPVLLGAVARSAGWSVAFVLCGGVFIAAAACGLLLDATRPVEEEPRA